MHLGTYCTVLIITFALLSVCLSSLVFRIKIQLHLVRKSYPDPCRQKLSTKTEFHVLSAKFSLSVGCFSMEVVDVRIN
jgi:hypothetical protein